MSKRSIHMEVLRAFADAQQLAGEDGREHGIYAPPWHDRLPNNQLGPPYGATSPVSGGPTTYHQASAEHAEGRFPFSSGLWDHAEEHAMKTDQPSRLQKRIIERYDSKAVAEYMSRRGHLIAKREAEVYVAFWVEGRSYQGVARHLEMAVGTVRDLVKKLRNRVRR